MLKDDLWKLHALVTDWIKVADAKATFIITLIGVIATIFGVLGHAELMVIKRNIISFTALISSGLYSLISIVASLKVLYPTLATKYNRVSNLYFKDIAAHADVASYQKSIDTQNSVETELTSQIFINSNIANKKFLFLQWSIWFLGFELIAFTISIISSLGSL